MRLFSCILLCGVALLSGACEKQPLPGDPSPSAEHAKHEGEAHPAAAEQAKPAEAGKTHGAEATPAGEAPKFFPENK